MYPTQHQRSHQHQLYCPYPFCPRHTKGFNTPKALAAHIKATECLQAYYRNRRINAMLVPDDGNQYTANSQHLDEAVITLTQANAPTSYIRVAQMDRLHPSNNTNHSSSSTTTNDSCTSQNQQNNQDQSSPHNSSHSTHTSMDESSDPQFADFVITTSTQTSNIDPNSSLENPSISSSLQQHHQEQHQEQQQDNDNTTDSQVSPVPFSNIPHDLSSNDMQQHQNNNDIPSQNDPLQKNLICSTPELRSGVSMMRLLEDMSAPNYALNEILKWAEQSSQQNVDFARCHKTRKVNINWIHNTVKGSKHLRPMERPVQLEDGRQFNVVVFDFAAQLLSLLQDESIMQWDNLALNKNNPFQQYSPPDDRKAECNSASCY